MAKANDDALVLGNHEVRTLPIKVKGRDGRMRTYAVPLRGSLKIADILLFRVPENLDEDQRGMHAVITFHAFLSRYLPKEVVDDLDMDDINSFYEAWDAASEEDGVSSGE